MSIQEIWKITQKLGTVFDMYELTVKEVDEIYSQISKLFHVSKDKNALLRAINREGRLIDYQNRRKENTSRYKRKNYQTNKSLALQKLREHTQNGFDSNDNIVYFVFQEAFDFWTKDLSQTSKWRIKKELEDQEVKIIENYTDLKQF